MVQSLVWCTILNLLCLEVWFMIMLWLLLLLLTLPNGSWGRMKSSELRLGTVPFYFTVMLCPIPITPIPMSRENESVKVRDRKPTFSRRPLHPVGGHVTTNNNNNNIFQNSFHITVLLWTCHGIPCPLKKEKSNKKITKKSEELALWTALWKEQSQKSCSLGWNWKSHH